MGAPLEWFPNDKYRVPSGKPGSPPAFTRIKVREPSPGSTAFEIPASGRSGGLLIFAFIWLAILSPITFIHLFIGPIELDVDIDISENYQWLLPFAVNFFLILFWVIGLVILHKGLSAKFSKHLILLKDDHLAHGRELFWTKKATSFPFSEISSIAAIEFYEKNYTPVFGIEIRSPGKKVRFGSSLSNEEKGWLVAELNHLVFPPAEKATPTGETSSNRLTSQGPFEVPIPRRKMKAIDWVGVPIGLVISGSFIAIGLSPLMEDDGTFRLLWTGMSSIFFLVIVATLVWQASQRSTQKRIVSDGTHLSLRKVRHHRTRSEKQLLPLTELNRVALYPLGGSNAEIRYAASLITATRVIPLFRWLPREIAQDVVQELCRKLSLPSQTFSE